MTRTAPPPPVYAADFPDLALVALDRLQIVLRHEDREPPQRTAGGDVCPTWLAWHDQLHRHRAALSSAVDALMAHPDYERAHRREYRDLITVRSRSVAAWGPVARRVARDLSHARVMA